MNKEIIIKEINKLDDENVKLKQKIDNNKIKIKEILNKIDIEELKKLELEELSTFFKKFMFDLERNVVNDIKEIIKDKKIKK